jgi:hypothetical protein
VDDRRGNRGAERQVTIVSFEDFEERRRALPWPSRIRHKVRLRMRLRHLVFCLRHPRKASAQRNGTF